jgi:hypothetical protein
MRLERLGNGCDAHQGRPKMSEGFHTEAGAIARPAAWRVRVSQQPIVRVVVGEAGEPHPGPVRWALDIEGFDVVGQGSSRAELERVLAGVDPTVIVVDDAIPASALIALRAMSPSAGVVVVWPASVSSKAIADAHVDPGCIEEDLGRAVRRAARRSRPAVYDPPVAVGEALLILPDAELPRPLEKAKAPVSSAGPRRSARVLAGTAAVLALIVMMVGVSFALDATRGSHPAASPSVTHAPAASSTSSSAPAGSEPDGVGAAGTQRPDCGPRVDPRSKASSNAHPADNATLGTRSANCGGANAGGGASNAGGNGSTGQRAGNGPTTVPTDHGQAGSNDGDAHPAPPDQTNTGHGSGSSTGRGRFDSPGNSDQHGAAGTAGRSSQ